MKPDLIMLHVVAAVITLLGGWLMWWHRAQWVQQQLNPQLEPAERLFLKSQYRRRMQASAMLTTLGVLLNGSNEFLIPWQRFPLQFFIYVTMMLVVTAWMVLLAMGDWFATRAVHQAALARLKEHQRHLERTVGQMRNYKDQ